MAKDIRTQFNFIKKSIKRGKVFFKDNLIFKNIKAVGEPVTNTLISFNDKNVPVAKATGEEIFFNDFIDNISMFNINFQIKPNKSKY